MHGPMKIKARTHWKGVWAGFPRQFGRSQGWENKFFFPFLFPTPDSPVRSIVTIPTALTRLFSEKKEQTYYSTYLLTPWRRVLLEKLTGLQPVKKFPAFHGTRRFITALTSVRHLSLSWASPIQSIHPHPTSWRSILLLSTHLRLGLPSGILRSGFPTKALYTPLSSPTRATCPAQGYFTLLLIIHF